MASAAERADTIEEGVLAQVVLGQRLLQQEEVELVELPQQLRVGEGVCRVGIRLEHHLRTELAADRPDRLDVPARLDLDLDPRVALGEVAGDGGQQGVHRVVDADRHPGCHR